MPIPQSDSLSWPNNVNTTIQADQRGSYQNIAYYDNDDGMQIGPNDVRITQLMQTPLNVFRPHVSSDFNETTLDPKWTFTPYASGTLSLSASKGGEGNLCKFSRFITVRGARRARASGVLKRPPAQSGRAIRTVITPKGLRGRSRPSLLRGA